MNDTDLFFFNGINGATGNYLLPAMSAADLAKLAQGEEFDKDHLDGFKYLLFMSAGKNTLLTRHLATP